MKIFTAADEKVIKGMEIYHKDFQHFPCGLAAIKNDTSCTLIQANPAFYQIIGHTEMEFWEKHENRMTDILIDDFFDVVQKQPTEKDYDIQWDIRIRRADGGINWIHDVAHYDASLNVFYVVYTDNTDKMIATDKHLSYNAFLARNAILGYINLYTAEHITVTDAITDEIVYMNQSAEELLGFHQESDWLGKPYWEVGFGGPDQVHAAYTAPINEDEFTVRDYYNHFHKMYVHGKSKIITVPGLQRKLRLNIISDVTAQTRLEHKIQLQKTLHKCMDALFTTGATHLSAQDAYYDILNELKEYYQSTGAFFYKFVEGTNQVEKIYEVSADGQKKSDHVSPMEMTEAQIRLMQALSQATPHHHQTVIDSFQEDYPLSLMELHAKNQIHNFTCVAVNNPAGQIVAFMGVINPHLHKSSKDLLDLLSRFVYLFMSHQQDVKLKAESAKLETISKLELVEKCGRNFQDLLHPQENVQDSLEALCHHYDADFAIILSQNEDGVYGVSHTAGKCLPDLSGLRQSSHFMGNWLEAFEKHDQFASDLDFDDASAPMVKKMLLEKFGIYNFVASPLRNTEGSLTGLLIVNNLNLTNRSHLMVHVVAKNIADYWEKIRMQQESQLEPLTKLANKIATQTQISKHLQKEEQGTLFVIDIDNFKELNDTLGHQVGDQAIVDIAAILKHLFRSSDVIGRVGGDEFMVFTPGRIPPVLLEEKAKQLLQTCQRTYQKDQRTAEISVSIGACSADDTCKTFHSLYERADQALYLAKHNGKNRYHIDRNKE